MEKDVLSRFLRLAENMREAMVGSKDFYNEISKSEFIILMHIDICKKKYEVVTTSMLSKQMNISKPAVSQMLSSLEEKNYVERQIFKDDKRLTCIFITDEGEKILTKKMNAMTLKLQHTLEQMGKEDSEQLITLMEKFYSIATDTYEK